MSEKIGVDGEWTRLTFVDDFDTGSMAVLCVRDAGVTLLSGDEWRTWEYRVEMVVSESEATDAVPAGEYVVSKGYDLGTPQGVTDPMGPLETLADCLDNDREHVDYAERERYGDDCPEDGAKCLALTASAELRHFLTMWGEELGCWASEREEARLAERRGE